jgi:antitoxin component YwqK of YwqJK toxin-antitoxin module
MKRSLPIILALTLFACTPKNEPVCYDDKLASIHIIDRNGLQETITNVDRLEQYSQVDFLKPQSYQKVLRIYGRDKLGNIKAYVTSYHENGQPKQYLEIRNTRAMGTYREWYPNGTMRIDTNVIGGDADITPQAENSWLFDGPARYWNEKGILVANILYARGELHGVSTYYHSLGTPQKTIPYAHGMVEGMCQFYDADGTIIQVAEFSCGKLHGQTTRYWSADIPQASEEYYEGLLSKGTYWDKNGNIVSEINEGFGFRTVNNPDGKFQEEEFKKGIQEGIVKIFNKEGILTKSFHIKNGIKHGQEVEYYLNPLSKKSSLPKLMVHWSEGKIQGVCKTWYDNGVLESQREMSHNRKNGLSTAWYQNGSVMMIEEYEMDKLVKGEYFKPDIRRPVSKVKNGEGEVTLFSADGTLLQKIPYIHGHPEEV